MSPTVEASTPSTDPIQSPTFGAAYQEVIGEIRAVPDSEVVFINIDIPSAVTTALGVLPEVRAVRAQLAELAHFDIARFDKLESYIMAAGYAHATYMLASSPTESIDKLSQEASDLREILLADASALATHGVIDGQKLKDLKGPNGFRNQAFDLLALTALLRANWTAIAGKIPLQVTDLDRAEKLANRLVTAVGLREQGPAIVADAQDVRSRAFTLFVTTYDQARRGLSYLRWNEGDIDEIAPSLYAARAARRKAAAPVPATPATPVVAGPSAGVPVAPAAHDGAQGAASHAVGMPGSSPFVQ